MDALKISLTVETPQEWSHCMCFGTPAIYLFRADEKLGEITNHHGYSIRCSLWDSGAELSDREKWLNWFDERGINGPRQEVEEMFILDAEIQRNWQNWLAAIPVGIEALWQNSLGTFG